MPYCASCAVEVEEHRQTCPLCQGVLQPGVPVVTGRFPADSVEEKALDSVPWPLIRTWVMEGVTLMGILACLIVAIVDWSQGRGLQWSLYAMAPVLSAALLARTFLYAWGRPVAIFGQLLTVTSLLVLTLDLVDGQWSWSLTMALPVIAMAAASFGGWLLAILRWKLPWEAAAASCFGAVIVFCTMLDAWISLRRGHGYALGWSLPVTAALAPWLMIVLYTGRRLRTDPRWKRFFHL